MRRVSGRVRTTVRWLCRGDREADDLFQDVIVEILRAASTYQARGTVEAWVDGVTSRAVKSRLRRYWRTRQTVVLTDRELGEARQDPERALLRSRQNARVAELLARIKPAKRLALVLKLVHGYSVREIAEMTDTPDNTVRDRLKKGRAQLKRAMLRDDLLRQLVDVRET